MGYTGKKVLTTHEFMHRELSENAQKTRLGRKARGGLATKKSETQGNVQRSAQKTQMNMHC